ncbi:hypothetical protein VTL71DRAFT_14879 [Oculimacula yallundae]|uniref:Uncharacterized protein n=1 Tax=Oculimacula yallundae TaxID=86028 RepID=A0ABR4CF07_9HELO
MSLKSYARLDTDSNLDIREAHFTSVKMPLFDPDTDMNLGDDFSFDEEDSSNGYAGPENLGFGVSIDGVQVPLRTSTHRQSSSPHSSSPRAPATHPSERLSHASNTPSTPATRARSESSESFSSGSTHMSNSDNGRGDDQPANLVDGAANVPVDEDDVSTVDDSDSDDDDVRGPEQRSKGKERAVLEEEEEEDDEEEDENGDEGGDEENDEEEEVIVQVEHKSRWQPDFGLRRPGLSEAEVSFIRDGWSVLRVAEGKVFDRPNGGAWTVKPIGKAAVTITDDENVFLDAIKWALGKTRPKVDPSRTPEYRESYRAARIERSYEFSKRLDVGRVKGMLDAAQMKANRQLRIAAVSQLVPAYDSKQKATDAQVQAIINAIAGKPINLADFKDRINNHANFQHAPLPLTMQVDPVLLPAGPATTALIESTVRDWEDEKKILDEARLAARDLALEAAATAAAAADKDGDEDEDEDE